ncbi:CIPK23 [Symbiodinium sp. CCMP2456]|nr:CIPK23 [Symbiodinium sp. CCMP2456]
MGYERCAEFSSECQPDRGWSFVEGLAKLRCPCCGERQKDQNEQQHGDVFVRLEGEQTFEAFFQIGELIGHGTFGKVYCCRPFRADDLCVKVVATTGRHAARASKLPNEEKLQLLRRIASVQHPNIVRYHQFLQSNDSLYVVMSRCLGPDLAEHLEGVGHLKLQDVKSLSRMMLSAVAAVHQRGRALARARENFRFRDQFATTLQAHSLPSVRKPSCLNVKPVTS